MEIIKNVLGSGGRPVPDKLNIAIEIDRQLKILRLLFHLAYDLKTINQHQRDSFDESAKELGRLLGGWRKELLEKPQPSG